MRKADSKHGQEGSLERWLDQLPDGRPLAEMAALLRAAAGGGVPSAGAVEEQVAAGYFTRGPRSESELARLDNDVELRRLVGSIGRALPGALRDEGVVKTWLGPRRWAVAALLAACVSGAVIASQLFDGDEPAINHRSGGFTAADVHLIGPEGTLGAAPRIEWRPVSGADLYEVEVTTADGRMIFHGQTSRTDLQVPPDILNSGVPYFYRVRARVEISRWVSSEFREFVVR